MLLSCCKRVFFRCILRKPWGIKCSDPPLYLDSYTWNGEDGIHFSCTAWDPSSPFRAVEGTGKSSCKDRQLNLLKVEACVQGIFLFLGFFKLLMVDSVGVQLLTATYKHCCRISLSLLQILGLCYNFRTSVFVYPIIDLILVLRFQQVAIVSTDLANFYIWSHKTKWQRQSLVVNTDLMSSY